MHFKLDWSFVKDYVIRTQSHRISKQDFYGLEDRINFHSLPLVSFTNIFLGKNPEKYRVVPRKLFFDFFPEFNDNNDWDNKVGVNDNKYDKCSCNKYFIHNNSILALDGDNDKR